MRAYLLSSFGRPWKRFLANLGSLLLRHQFQKCTLQVPVDQRAGLRCIAPICQCGSLLVRDEPMTVSKRIMWKKGRRKQVRMPRWVARSQLAFEVAGAAPMNVVPPRYETKVLPPTPLGMQGVRCLYKKPGCLVALADPHIFSSIDVGLREMGRLLSALLQEHEAYFGPVGISTDTSDLRAAMLKAFNWTELLQLPQPKPEHVKVFRFLLRRFEKILSKTEWPDPAVFPYVQRNWSANGAHEAQYIILVRNVLDLSKQAAFQKQWNTTTHYSVEPLNTKSNFLPAFVPYLRFCGWTTNSLLCVAHVVTSFCLPNISQSWRVRPECLCSVGSSTATRGWGLQKARYRGTCFASIVSSFPATHLANQIVQVNAQSRTLDIGAIAASIDLCPEVHACRSASHHAWHAAFVHHVSRAHVCAECLG